MEFVNQFQTYSQQSRKSFAIVEEKLNAVSKKIKTPSDIKRKMTTTKLQKNRMVPSELLDNEGEIISYEAAFKYSFPGEEFDLEDLNLTVEEPKYYKEYEIVFNDLPEE
ncbi:Hypothetical_protein [Hexamita inflata]|uniref:Hypothetical_protein n=1 Tax=Hexamita inflata TaxID=28002 RepID=A0AA86R4R6_9EUKA|nr:Hypothetical protein HINF_LOCUS41267 [Hexamita inflata]CAI9966108.1 Hypothetical protein HINF_LOCUS53753 [Hexamita inflata]